MSASWIPRPWPRDDGTQQWKGAGRSDGYLSPRRTGLQPGHHKRLMLAAALFLAAAADRAYFLIGDLSHFPFVGERAPRKIFGVIPLLALIAYDAMKLRRPPWLALGLLGLAWAVLWLFISDLLFMSPAREGGINLLAGVAGLKP